jgi:hypothetical protein
MQRAPAGECTVECCNLANNVVEHGANRYTCVRHGRCHTCDGVDRAEDPHPVVIVNPEFQHVCGFSAFVVGTGYSNHDYSDDAFSAKHTDDDAMGTRAAIFEAGTQDMLAASLRQRRTNRPLTSESGGGTGKGGRKAAIAAAKGVYDGVWSARLEQTVGRTLATLTDRGERARIAQYHERKALAEFVAADRKYARAARRECVRRSRVLREVCAERVAKKHRRIVPDMSPRDAGRWCRSVVCLWRLLVGESKERFTMPDMCASLVVGCLYGMAEGITHAKTGFVMCRPDQVLADTLPPPQDLAYLGIPQRTRSNGQKQLYRLVNGFVAMRHDPESACAEVLEKLAACSR